MTLGGKGKTLIAALLAGAAIVVPATLSHAQTGQTDPFAGSVAEVPPGTQMLVDADEIVYDYDAKVVTALGNVKVYYGGYRVEAERIVYDEGAKRLRALGRVKLTEPEGNVYYVEEFDFSDDFRQGFVRSLLVETTENTTMAAASAERLDENVTVFNRGVYTACEVCAEKPTFWTVKSARVIYNKQEETIRFDKPTLQFGGVTGLRLPSFVAPAPGKERQSGFLAPRVGYDEFLGASLRTPYYFALAPNYDLTVAPTAYTNQGLMMDALWRHRVRSGTYLVRAAGIHQLDPDTDEVGGDNQDWRGAIYSEANFSVSNEFDFGWSGWLQSDDTFLDTYNIDSSTDLVRQAYLRGFSERNSLEIYTYSFQRQSPTFDQDALPLVHPSLDYSYIFESNPFGGELQANMSAYSLSREDFADASRLVTSLDWRNRYISGSGIVVEPFTGVRGDLYTSEGGLYPNVAAGLNENTYTEEREAEIMPYVGGTVRYPFVATNSLGVHVIEPIAQVVARPSVNNDDIVNEDAQSLIFDDSTLFDLDKFSGYDRQEGGTRINLGARYTWGMNNGGQVSAMAGQSFHLAGDNPFPRDTGLASDRSDFVGALFVAPTTAYNGFARVRFDDENLDLRAIETQATGIIGRLSTTVQYAFYEAQPLLDVNEDRHQVAAGGTLALWDGWSLDGSLRYDLVDSLFVARSIGLSYINECFVFGLNYTESFDTSGERTGSYGFRVELRTLLEAGTSGTTSTGF